MAQAKHLVTPLAVTLYFFAPAAHAGAWPLPAGQGQTIITASGQKASESYDAGGGANTPTLYEKITAELYWEHGLTDTWTGVISSGIETVTIDSPGRALQSTTGVSATQFAARRLIIKSDNYVVSAQGGIIFGQSGENVPGATLGLGGTDFEIGGLAGASGRINGYDAFAQAHMARRFRSGGFADETRFDITTGIQPAPRVQIFLQGFYAAGEQSDRGFPAYRRLKIQPSTTYEYRRFRRVQLGLSHTVWGQNSLKDTGVFISVWRRY